MMDEMKPTTDDEFELIAQGTACASRFFKELVNVTDQDKRDLKRRVSSLRQKVLQSMLQLTDCHNRICDNYSMLIAATE